MAGQQRRGHGRRGCAISVYREHPDWGKYDKWWMLPTDLLRELFITYWSRSCDEDGDPIHSDDDDAQYVRDQYDFPVVLVY